MTRSEKKAKVILRTARIKGTYSEYRIKTVRKVVITHSGKETKSPRL